MDRLKRQVADQPDRDPNLVPPPRYHHKTFARTVQAAMTMGLTLGAVGFACVLGGILVLKAGSISFGQAIKTALPWGPILVVVGALIGAFEFRFLRRSRRD
jgi:hypothetical protein